MNEVPRGFETPTTGPPQPELLEWLRTGRLTLMDQARTPVEEEDWGELPEDVRTRALDEFHRVVRSNTKAAVLFLK